MDVQTRQLRQILHDLGHVPDILILKQSTTSTNDDVKAYTQKKMTSILVCSEMQTQGRGQYNRQWISPKGNIYLSTTVTLKRPIDGRLALEVALNILQIPKLQELGLQIKWPNDLYSTNGKWGGILVEPISSYQAIIGVGINLTTPISTQSLPLISSLEELGLTNINRIELIAQLYIAIHHAAQWFEYGSYNIINRFNYAAAFFKQEIHFEHHKGICVGRFEGINQEGAVLMTSQTQQHTFYQGRILIPSQEI